MKSKIIQLLCVPRLEGDAAPATIVALCEDGSVWEADAWGKEAYQWYEIPTPSYVPPSTENAPRRTSKGGL